LYKILIFPEYRERRKASQKFLKVNVIQIPNNMDCHNKELISLRNVISKMNIEPNSVLIIVTVGAYCVPGPMHSIPFDPHSSSVGQADYYHSHSVHEAIEV